jgi:hypothetical protein
MQQSFVFVDYVLWHYTLAFRDIVIIWLNMMWFFVHLFSLPLLMRTLFAPWKRVEERYRRTGFEDLIASLIINVMSRIVGAIIRLVIIVVGLLVLVLGVFGLIFWLLLWLVLPFLCMYGLFYGVMLLV